MKKNRVRRFDKPAPPQLIKPEEAEQIDYEICWCIERLENMLVKSAREKDKKQCQLSLKVLKNPETPIVRKRQVMRQHFGDYKKAIANIKKNSAIKNIISVEYRNNNGQVKSAFVRKKQDKMVSLADETMNKIQKTICGVQLSDNSFKFNF